MPSRATYAKDFKVRIGDLIEKALEGDSIELFHSHWKITNLGDFFSEFSGNCDHESFIEPTVVDTTNKDNLAQLTYTFRKENGELAQLKLQEYKPLE